MYSKPTAYTKDTLFKKDQPIDLTGELSWCLIFEITLLERLAALPYVWINLWCLPLSEKSLKEVELDYAHLIYGFKIYRFRKLQLLIRPKILPKNGCGRTWASAGYLSGEKGEGSIGLSNHFTTWVFKKIRILFF